MRRFRATWRQSGKTLGILALTSNANTDDNDYHLTRSSVQQQSLVAPREKLETS
jgi:hypothetical protein